MQVTYAAIATVNALANNNNTTIKNKLQKP